MSNNKHEQARELTEKALDALVEGDEGKADELIEKAKTIDVTAVTEVVADLDEDAGSNPDAAKV